MRIALIASLVSPIREPQSGGAQAFLADLATGLVSRGHEVDVFAASGSHIEGARCVDIGVDASTLREFLYHPASAPPTDPAPFAAAYSRVFERLSGRSYDAIHNHAFDAPAIRLAVGLDAPVIHTLHLPPEASVIVALRDVSRASDPPVVATVSRGQAEAWQQFINIDVVLPPGVSTKRIPWSATPGVGAVFAGRFSPEKGVVGAIAIAQKAGIPLDLYGDAYDDRYVEREVGVAARSGGVTVHAALPRTELWQVMASASVVLCPVGWDEPYGLVAAEAQACGTPVVAFRRGGLEDTVIDGVTGFLVAPEDIPAAAAAIGRVGEIARTSCRTHAEAHLDIEAALDAHEELYQRVLRSQVAPLHG